MGNWILSQESPYLIFKPFRLFYIPESRKNKQKLKRFFFLFIFMSFFSLEPGLVVTILFFFLGEEKFSHNLFNFSCFARIIIIKKYIPVGSLALRSLLFFFLWNAERCEILLSTEKPFPVKSHFQRRNFLSSLLNANLLQVYTKILCISRHIPTSSPPSIRLLQRLNFKCLIKCFAAEEPLRP